MGKPKWTREEIIRRILDLDAKGYPLTVGKPGVGQSLYQAGSRIFGSWRNALQAAGLSPDRGSRAERWPPAKILLVIRNLSQRRRPLRKKELEERFGSMVSAARRIFGSWSKAILASGVDPAKLRRVVPWTRERVLEALLTRALRNQPVSARLMEPRSIVEAGRRFFGSWSATLEAAGLDPAVAERFGRIPQKPPRCTLHHRHPACTAAEAFLDSGKGRRGHPVRGSFSRSRSMPWPFSGRSCPCTVRRDAISKTGEVPWLAAGLCPDKHRLVPRRPPKARRERSHAAERESQAGDALRPDRPAPDGRALRLLEASRKVSHF